MTWRPRSISAPWTTRSEPVCSPLLTIRSGMKDATRTVSAGLRGILRFFGIPGPRPRREPARTRTTAPREVEDIVGGLEGSTPPSHFDRSGCVVGLTKRLLARRRKVCVNHRVLVIEDPAHPAIAAEHADVAGKQEEVARAG